MPIRGRQTAWGVLAAAACAGAAWGQAPEGAAAAPSPPAERGGLVLTGQLDFARLLDLCSQRLKVNIEYDPAVLKQQVVTLRAGNGGLSDAELWTSTNQLLAQRGFTTVRHPGPAGQSTLTVVKLDEAARLARLEPVVDPAEAKPPTAATGGAGSVIAGFRSATFKLRHLSAKDAAEAIRPVLSRQASGQGAAAAPANVTSLGPGLMVVSDLSPRIDEVLAVLASQDTPDNATVVDEVPARNMSASQLATLVAQVVAKRDAVAGEKLPGEVLPAANATSLLVIAPRRVQGQWKSLITRLDQREPAETQTYSPRLFAVREVAALVQQVVGSAGTAGAVGSGDDRVRVLVEEPTGTLLVTATPTQHGRIAELMARLDNVPGEARRPLRTFTIRNRPVAELLTVLQKMIDAGALEAAGSDAAATQTTGPFNTPTGMSPAQLPGGATPLTATPSAPAISPPSAGRPLALGASAGGRGTLSAGTSSRSALPITLTADEATSTIIAVGDGRLLQQLEQLIKTLDVRQSQVMLEVILVSLSEGDALNLGVELEKLQINGSTLIRLSSLFGLSNPVTIGGQAARQAIEGDGFTGAVIDPGDFSVMIRAGAADSGTRDADVAAN